MLNLMLAGLMTAGLSSEDGEFVLSKSEVGLEVGTFARDNRAVLAPLVHTRLRIIDALAIELDLPFAVSDGGGEGTSVIGNIALSGRFVTKLENLGFFEVGLGLSLPTGYVSDENPSLDGSTQGIAGALLGLQPPYRYGEDLFAVFVPIQLEVASEQRAYLMVDGELSVLASVSEDEGRGAIIRNNEVGGAMAILLKGGYRPGPFDLSVGLGATALFGDRFSIFPTSDDNDVEAQTFVEPGIAFRVGPEDDLSGLEVGSRLRLLLDPPFGGNGLDEGFYAFSFDLRYRFDIAS